MRHGIHRAGLWCVAGLAAAGTLGACTSGTSGDGAAAPTPPPATPPATQTTGDTGTATPAPPPPAETTTTVPPPAPTRTVTVTPTPSDPIPVPPAPTTPPIPDSVPSGFVGTWSGHGRSMTIDSIGTVSIAVNGDQVYGYVSSVRNENTVTVTVVSTSDPSTVPYGDVRLGRDTNRDALALFAGTLSGTPFCGPSAPSGYCGA